MAAESCILQNREADSLLGVPTVTSAPPPVHRECLRLWNIGYQAVTLCSQATSQPGCFKNDSSVQNIQESIRKTESTINNLHKTDVNFTTPIFVLRSGRGFGIASKSR
jgi:hypothetical protein